MLKCVFNGYSLVISPKRAHHKHERTLLCVAHKDVRSRARARGEHAQQQQKCGKTFY